MDDRNFKIFVKSDQLSVKFLNEGNQKYKEKDFFNSLLAYNKVKFV